LSLKGETMIDFEGPKELFNVLKAPSTFLKVGMTL
jgi:hypothetical protein